MGCRRRVERNCMANDTDHDTGIDVHGNPVNGGRSSRQCGDTAVALPPDGDETAGEQGILARLAASRTFVIILRAIMAVILVAMVLRMIPGGFGGRKYIPIIVALMPWLIVPADKLMMPA